jgi:CRP-like cAMP-binding protein
LLVGHLSEKLVKPGTVLFSPGDAADRFYLVRSGELSRRVGADPASSRVAGFGPGTLAGEIEMLASGKRRDFLHADTESQIAELTRASISFIESQHPEIASLLFASISVELSARLTDALETISSLE